MHVEQVHEDQGTSVTEVAVQELFETEGYMFKEHLMTLMATSASQNLASNVFTTPRSSSSFRHYARLKSTKATRC